MGVAISAPMARGLDGPATGAAIEVRGLVRRFGEVTAVDGIDFVVPHGEIFGFLGPNGAGKSTTIKMLCTLLRPTAGQASVAGYDVVREPEQVRASLGIIFQDYSLDDRITAEENLRFHCMAYHVPRRERAARIRQMLEMVDLADACRRPRAHLLRRHEAPPGDRPRAAAPPRGAVPRRADGGPGPADAPDHLGAHPGAAQRGRGSPSS